MTRMLKTIVLLATLGLATGPTAYAAYAASAHNSQAGAFGPTTNAEGPTPASPGSKQIAQREAAQQSR